MELRSLDLHKHEQKQMTFIHSQVVITYDSVALFLVEHTSHVGAMFSKRPTHIPFICAALESSNYPPVILWLPFDHPLKCLKYLSLSGSVFSYNTVGAGWGNGGGVEIVKVVVQSLHVNFQTILWDNTSACCVCMLMEG